MKASNHPGGLSQPTPLRQPGPPSLRVARLIFASCSCSEPACINALATWGSVRGFCPLQWLPSQGTWLSGPFAFWLWPFSLSFPESSKRHASPATHDYWPILHVCASFFLSSSLIHVLKPNPYIPSLPLPLWVIPTAGLATPSFGVSHHFAISWSTLWEGESITAHYLWASQGQNRFWGLLLLRTQHKGTTPARTPKVFISCCSSLQSYKCKGQDHHAVFNLATIYWLSTTCQALGAPQAAREFRCLSRPAHKKKGSTTQGGVSLAQVVLSTSWGFLFVFAYIHVRYILLLKKKKLLSFTFLMTLIEKKTSAIAL